MAPEYGAYLVDVCRLCLEIAIEHGWIMVGTPTSPAIVDYRKRRRHYRFADERPADALTALYGEAKDQVPDPIEEKVAGELGDEVAAALGTLAPDYREVVERADLKGERYRDIADALEVPIGTVMSRLFRARRQLEAQLEAYAAEDYGIKRAA